MTLKPEHTMSMHARTRRSHTLAAMATVADRAGPAPLFGWRGLVPVAVAALQLLAPSAASAKDPSDPYIVDEVLVRLHSTATLAPLLARYPLVVDSQFGARPIYRLRITDGSSPVAQAEALAVEPGVLSAEPNGLHESPEGRKNVVWAIGSAAEYRAQWAPESMHLSNAHTLTRGAGVRVAVLDTGVQRNHPALTGKLVAGWDFVDDDADPSERGSTADAGYGHGTHVAGLVALVAPAAKIMPLRVLQPDGTGDTWVLSEALLHAVDPDRNPATRDGAHVINMSLGTLDRTRLMDAVAKLSACSLVDLNDPVQDFTDPGYDDDRARCATSQGAVIVAAAGNGGTRKERQYPAAEGVYGLIAVTASAENQRLATFANSGSWVDVAAPGDGITSSVPVNLYGTWSGTSMAAPLTAGAAALLRARQPRLAPAKVVQRLTRFGTALCGTNLLQVDADAALRKRAPVAPNCP